jgi:hypothetical protein
VGIEANTQKPTPKGAPFYIALQGESGSGSSENADLRDSILRQLKEMLNGLQGKGFPQLNDPDLSPQRPSRNLHKFQGSSRQFVPR